MFKIQRYANCGGRKKQWLKRFASGTIAYMCPLCYKIVYINGKYDYNINTNIEEFNFYTEFIYNCPCCDHTVKGIELDPNIAESISELNRKGYITEFCCEGHISKKNYQDPPYISFSTYYNSIKNLLPKSWYIDEDYNMANMFVIRGDIKHYSKKQILKDLENMVNDLPIKRRYNNATNCN